MFAGQLVPQVRFVMTYIDDLLHGFDARTSDLSLLVCHFASDGEPETSTAVLNALADSVSGPLPPVTLVPQPNMHSADALVEIWGVARA